MNYPYFFVYKNGVVCKQGKFSSSCFVTSTGKFITSSEKGRNLIKGKKLIFIRGLEYIFFSILFFIKNFNNIEIKNKLEENEQNINKNNKKYNIYLKYLCIFLFSIIYYFIFGIFLPIKISEILKVFYLGEFFKRFVIGILRVIILCLPV